MGKKEGGGGRLLTGRGKGTKGYSNHIARDRGLNLVFRRRRQRKEKKEKLRSFEKGAGGKKEGIHLTGRTKGASRRYEHPTVPSY